MNEIQRKELRVKYAKEYEKLTGYRLICNEIQGVNNTKAQSVYRNHIIKIAEDYFKIAGNIIVSKSREAHLIEIRQFIAAVLKSRKLSSVKIMGILKYPQHTILLNTQERFTERYITDEEYRMRYDNFLKYCNEQLMKLKDVKKMDITKAEQIRKLYHKGTAPKDLAKSYKVSRTMIYDILNNVTYKK